MNFRFIFLFSFITAWFQPFVSAGTNLAGKDQQNIVSSHVTEAINKIWPAPVPSDKAPVPGDQELPDQDEPGEDASDDSHPFTGYLPYTYLYARPPSDTTEIVHLSRLFNNWSTLPLFVLHHSWKSFLFLHHDNV